jgi:transcriptional regulator with XRE-family HTH domain
MSHPVIVSRAVTACYGEEYTDLPKKSQIKNSDSQKVPGLIERIGEAIGTKKTGEIAKFLKISPSTVSDWKAGSYGPTLLHLLTLAEFGNPELTLRELFIGPVEHKAGLSTSAGKAIREQKILSESEEQAVIELAKERGIPLEEMVRTIVVTYLLQQGLITLEDLAEAADKVRIVGRARGKREPMAGEIYEVNK